ncbi:hypothetical protein [Paraburkholderia tropica]|uniref:hypothetical protein n=1 Tax=Paraburkholderia tropica TaxID=92647 RepID=UPI0016094591|nr:hypothetical protein [Paraburkholderia tropica]MBB2981737.1 hypothetical protein [Paraburkholderia tropica]
MDRLIASNSVPMAQADTAPTTGTPQGATDGNPASNVPATRWPSYQYNAIQEELIAILTAAGVTPDRTNNGQIAAAIKALRGKTSVLADTGAVNAYAAVNATPLTATTWIDGVTQAVKIAHTNTGGSTYAPDGLAAIPIYGLGLAAVQQGELFAGGTAILMRMTIAGVNSGNPICVLMECAGGPQQVAAATASQHAVQFAQVATVAGTARNLNALLTAQGASATWTADELLIKSALGGLAYQVGGFNKTVSLGGAGIGGVVGTVPAANGFAAIYAAIGSSGVGIFATDATSAKAPEVYGGTLPVGYAYGSQLISIAPISAIAGQFAAFVQTNRRVGWAGGNIVAGSSFTGSNAVTPSTAYIPPNARFVTGYTQLANSSASSASSISVTIQDSVISGAGGWPNAQSVPASSSIAEGFSVAVSTSQSIYRTVTASGGTPSHTIAVTAFEF